jgi:plastocyanin
MRTLTRLVPLGLVAVALSVPTSVPTAVAAPVPVAVLFMSYSPATVTVAQGGSVTWTNNSGIQHTATSFQNFFNTGNLSGNGGSANRVFSHTGTFRYFCLVHGTSMSGTVKVPLKAPTGAVNGFTLRWSAVGSSLTNRSFDVQKNSPGASTGWTALRTNTTTRSAFLNPTRNGTWQYRARTDNRSNGKSSGWSPIKSVTVS